MRSYSSESHRQRDSTGQELNISGVTSLIIDSNQSLNSVTSNFYFRPFNLAIAAATLIEKDAPRVVRAIDSPPSLTV